MQNDRGNIAPISLLLISLGTVMFQAIVFNGEYAQESFLPTVDMPDCDVYGDGIAEGIKRIGCHIGAIATAIANIFIVIFGVGAFLANAFTFNVPGAPWYVRALFTAFFSGGIAIFLASLFRGTRA